MVKTKLASDAMVTDEAVTEAVTFVDLKFKNRTLVLTDGRTFVVEKSRIVASDPALITYLDGRADFARADDGTGD